MCTDSNSVSEVIEAHSGGSVPETAIFERSLQYTRKEITTKNKSGSCCHTVQPTSLAGGANWETMKLELEVRTGEINALAEIWWKGLKGGDAGGRTGTSARKAMPTPVGACQRVERKKQALCDISSRRC